MNRIEQLISEYGSLNFHFKEDMPEGLSGLISENNVYVNNKLPFEELYATLAEEIGHYETAPGDIIDQSQAFNRKYESLGRRWGYKKLVPLEKLQSFIESRETTHYYDLAEEFEIPHNMVNEVIQMYRVEGKI